MSKFVLIVAALVASVAMAAPSGNEGEQNPPGVVVSSSEREIDWSVYLDEEVVDPNPETDKQSVSDVDNDQTDNRSRESDKENVNDARNDEADDNKRVTDCGPSEEQKEVEGMQEWCRANCLNNPSYCPPSHCKCW